MKKDLDDLINSGISLSCAAKYLAKKEKVTKNFIYNLHKSGNHFNDVIYKKNNFYLFAKWNIFLTINYWYTE